MSQQTSAVQVDFIKEDEYQQWLPHWQNYQAFYQVDLSDAVTQTTWARFFDTNEQIYCAVAREGNKVLGFVHFLYHRSTWAVTDYCYLEDLFVALEARGKHIGKQLIDFVAQHAKKHDSARLYWHTQQTNTTAQRLYDWVANKPGVIEYRMPL